MRVLDLFCGLKGWSAPFAERGHEVITIDMDPEFKPTIVANVLDLPPFVRLNADIVLASPPCEAFSVAAMGYHWTGGKLAYLPDTEHAHTSLALVHWTLALIESTRPKFWVVENPRGMLRNLGLMNQYERITVSYCQYGDTSMKPTDLWGGFPPSWQPRPMCRNGADCHESAPRGAKTGTQGKQGAAARAEIPYELALELCLAMEGEVRPNDANPQAVT